MNDTNKWYNTQNGNSHTAKFPKFLYRSNSLTTFGQKFCLIFSPKFSQRESRYGKKEMNIDSNYHFYLFNV
jgi:hypothetical protein